MLKPILFLMLCSAACGADIYTPAVTVFGTATTEVTPDQMIWSLNVKNKSASLETAAKEHTATVQQVLNLFKDQKLPENKIQTAQMEFGENQEYKNNSWVQAGYYASTDIAFTLDDFKKYQPLWIALSRIPNVSVRAVRYDHSRRIDFQNETRTKAVIAAREKARSMAQALGATIAEPVMIQEDLSVNESWSFGNASNNIRAVEGPNAPSEEPLALGRIPIKCRVKAAFRLVSP